MDEAAEEAVATALAFADAAGAHRVILLIDRGDDTPALMVDAVHDGTAEVTDGDVVEHVGPAPMGGAFRQRALQTWARYRAACPPLRSTVFS